MRAIAPCLPARQSWRLVDNDNVLIDTATKAAPPGAGVTAVVLDLAGALEQALESCDLVATSALLDLVSAAWLDRLVASLVRLSRPFYAALSYDRIVALRPETPHTPPLIPPVHLHHPPPPRS